MNLERLNTDTTGSSCPIRSKKFDASGPSTRATYGDQNLSHFSSPPSDARQIANGSRFFPHSHLPTFLTFRMIIFSIPYATTTNAYSQEHLFQHFADTIYILPARSAQQWCVYLPLGLSYHRTLPYSI
jgi:hypothetical protein